MSLSHAAFAAYDTVAEALGCTPDEVDSAVVGEEEPDMVVAHFKAPPPEDTPHAEEPGSTDPQPIPPSLSPLFSYRV